MDWWGRSHERMSQLMDYLESLFDGGGAGPNQDLDTTSSPSFAAVTSTANADGQFGWLYRKTVTLTNAQILTLLTVPVDIIPAPGANKVIAMLLPGPGGAVLKAVAAYTNDSANQVLGFMCAGYGLQSFLSRNLMTFGSDAYLPFSGPNATFTIDVTSGPEGLPGLVNQPVKLFLGNTAGDLTGGNDANTLRITVYYTIVDVP